ncbi:MAG: SRPBCC family protein, partial [Verrucomicrobiota bacterium]
MSISSSGKVQTTGGPLAQDGEKNPRAEISVPGNSGIKVVQAVTIRKPAAQLYAFWRDLTNLSQVIKHPVTITMSSHDDSHWVVSAPGGQVQWDAIIINDSPDRLIA